MNIVIGLCHVDFSNIDIFSESYLKQIVACEIISISSSATWPPFSGDHMTTGNVNDSTKYKASTEANYIFQMLLIVINWSIYQKNLRQVT